MAIKNLVELGCDVCSKVVTVNTADADSAEQTNGWMAVKRQEGKVADEFMVCSGACLSKLAERVMELAVSGR